MLVTLPSKPVCCALNAENIFAVENILFQIQSAPKNKPSLPHEPSWKLLSQFPKGIAKHLCVSEAEAGLEDHARMSGAWVPPGSWEAELAHQSGNCIAVLWGWLTFS